ncbi:MAG: sugar kinase [Pseudomonadota bacterium]
MSDLLCLGEPLVEFVRLEDGTYRRGVGGDTSNAAIAAARQGASVGYITALGADRFGESIRSLWQAEKVDASNVASSPTLQTGIYFIDPDPAGRFFTYYRKGSAASQMRPEDLATDAIEAARCIHLSGITLAVSDDLRATAQTAIDVAKHADVAISLDTNLRMKLWDIETARDVTHTAAKSAKIVITSIDDSLELTGLEAPDRIAEFYERLGVEIVLVTMGEQGCYLASPDARAVVAAAPATPVDSTGAGDSFAGSFLAWWLETGDPAKAARSAAIVAAGTVSGLGAVDPIPRREDVLTALR